MTSAPEPVQDNSPAPSDEKPRLGLALGSGGARGWAHVGVLRALDELGVEVDVYAGCSAGALVSGAHLLGCYSELIDWAKTIGPIGAMSSFILNIQRGGVVDPEKAFDRFRSYDKPAEELAKPWGAVATDLATGKEVWLIRGSTIEAMRASSAVPMVFQAARYVVSGEDHWLIDGGASNPVPVTLARGLGADRIIAVDLNGVINTLSRFNRPATRAVVPVENNNPDDNPLGAFIREQQQEFKRRLALAKARSMAQPQFFETALATIDIVQSHLSESRARTDVADVRLLPDLSMGTAASFDKWQEFEQAGYETTMAASERIRAAAGMPHKKL